jgi:hypothetical protein
MVNEEFYNDPVKAIFSMDEAGQVTVQQVTWQGQSYRVIGLGRQWDEPDGRHVLAEMVGGMRLELQLRHEDLTWRVKRVWRAPAAA